MILASLVPSVRLSACEHLSYAEPSSHAVAPRVGGWLASTGGPAASVHSWGCSSGDTFITGLHELCAATSHCSDSMPSNLVIHSGFFCTPLLVAPGISLQGSGSGVCGGEQELRVWCQPSRGWKQTRLAWLGGMHACTCLPFFVLVLTTPLACWAHLRPAQSPAPISACRRQYRSSSSFFLPARLASLRSFSVFSRSAGGRGAWSGWVGVWVSG